jgi:hypothetical protein
MMMMENLEFLESIYEYIHFVEFEIISEQHT